MRPIRLVPRRSPPFWHALAITLGALAAAILARMALLGPDRGFSLSVSYFPAFVLATLYAGSRWGWASLAFTIALQALAPSRVAVGSDALPPLALFAVSGAVTVFVASALRSTLLRLEAAQREREDARAELERTESRLRLAQEAGGIGLWDHDVARGELYWSPTAYKNLGLDPATPASIETMLQAIHPDDRDAVARAVEACRRTGHLEVEYRVGHGDGGVRWVLSRGEVIRDEAGRVLRALGVNFDITDRRIAFEKTRQSEARFRILADSAPVLMWVSRTDGKREFVNKAYVDFLKADYDAALQFDWRSVLHPEDVDRILKEQIAGESSRQLFTLEARYRRYDGEYRWVRSVSQPRYSPTGEFEGFVGVGYDISHAKRAEADLKRINDLLSERVQAALQERDEAEAALRRAQKLEAVGQLTGGVAHDFNNLLTVIIGALDLLQRNPGDGARAERMVEAALSAARRGERLTQQLLAFSRRQALKPELVCVDDLLTESEPLLRRAVGEAVNLKVSPAAGEAVAHVDPSQFEAAIMNLVVNARDATPNGGAIRVESLACTLRAGQVEEIEPGDYVCVLVHDTGAGMDADTAQRVFEPFFTTKAPGRGTGLGLSQVYGFARQSGGGVAIDSAPGKGTTVRVYLPLASQSARRAEPAPPAAPERRSRGLRILLVEDDLEVGAMVEAMLSDLGHAVTRTDGPAEALRRLARREPVDLLITDVVMPGDKTGVDLAREATAMRPGLPVILSSGYAGETLQAAAAAPWPLLRKPYASDLLARMIAEAVGEAATA